MIRQKLGINKKSKLLVHLGSTKQNNPVEMINHEMLSKRLKRHAKLN